MVARSPAVCLARHLAFGLAGASWAWAGNLATNEGDEPCRFQLVVFLIQAIQKNEVGGGVPCHRDFSRPCSYRLLEKGQTPFWSLRGFKDTDSPCYLLSMGAGRPTGEGYID